MVYLNVSDNKLSEVSEYVKRLVEEKQLKYLNVDDSRTLVCNDGAIFLRRRIALNLKVNVTTKTVFVHAYDPEFLFREVIKLSVIDVLGEFFNSMDIYVVCTSPEDYIKEIVSTLNSDRSRVHLINSRATLEHRIHSDRGEKKVILNFEPSCSYVQSDIFIYFCFLTSGEEIRKMFRLGLDESLSNFLIIDTLVQSCNASISFVGSDRNDISLQKCMAFYKLENCPQKGKRVFDLINNLIFAAVSDESSSEVVRDDSRGEEETHMVGIEENDNADDDFIDSKIQESINSATVCYIDHAEQQSYLVNFIKSYLGDIREIHTTDSAWWSLMRCSVNPKIAIFAYTRTVPNFKLISAYVNGWKHLNRHQSNGLICIVLVSPVIYASCNDALLGYRSTFRWLLNQASTVNCCEGLHCDTVLKRQFNIDDTTCPGNDPQYFLDNLGVLELILKIFRDLEAFIKSKENSQDPVFHELDLVDGLSVINHPHDRLVEAIVASYLYRGIPVVGQDGRQKVCTHLCDISTRNDIFVVKNDRQKYMNLSTITGSVFNNAVQIICDALTEEY